MNGVDEDEWTRPVEDSKTESEAWGSGAKRRHWGLQGGFFDLLGRLTCMSW